MFYLFGRPYTFEALLYGAAISGMFVTMMLWFGCYNKVLTSDKFTSLFGNLIPSLSLLLVMVLRMVPNFIRKTQQIIGARKSIGKGVDEAAATKEKLNDGMTVLGALTSWALEGSVVTGDSMRSRGYGTAKRTSFMIYRMTATDYLLLSVMVLLMVLVILAACLKQMAAAFTPVLDIAPVSWGVIAYTGYLLIPTALHIKEAIQWHISRSKI
jgi:energy-coupling factor transport system permease protein